MFKSALIDDQHDLQGRRSQSTRGILFCPEEKHFYDHFLSFPVSFISLNKNKTFQPDSNLGISISSLSQTNFYLFRLKKQFAMGLKLLIQLASTKFRLILFKKPSPQSDRDHCLQQERIYYQIHGKTIN